MSANKQSTRKLLGSIFVLVLLGICLAATTFALARASVCVVNNQFHTGTIKINLNDGKPVIEEYEFLFEPGMTVKKDFFIENQGTWDVYYKLYFDNVSGGLADVLQITVMNDTKKLYQGTVAELNRKAVGTVEEPLPIGQTHDLTAYFHFPKEIGNSAQGLTLAFTLCADAVQTKNNPTRAFD